ncbi:response regulator [Euzebyella marina]|uniref:Response regulator n=1 Tax=Euzebyella marina TaxID=1761453 RepID=A0A3G2L8X2_9FLAO|nr:response regulator [Euzebyella marina]AYN68699.1 response regulator [Euzebyella marina]MAU72219.1 response regulator [Pseudozobellia sp.]MBG49805.1 response regulator [Pseudozobellia sp.]|tara:strand:+ start:261 stop:671 length:411 start_codon:yes stop_codon:yes gene_type:complete
MRKANILLVDDDEIYLYLTERLLDGISENLAVNSFTDGEKALDYIKNCANEQTEMPGVILLDVNMPFLDGWGFLKEFRELKPKINDKVHIYLVTSSERERDKERAKEFKELTGYVVKPVSEDNLVEILTEVYENQW